MVDYNPDIYLLCYHILSGTHNSAALNSDVPQAKVKHTSRLSIKDLHQPPPPPTQNRKNVSEGDLLKLPYVDPDCRKWHFLAFETNDHGNRQSYLVGLWKPHSESHGPNPRR